MSQWTSKAHDLRRAQAQALAEVLLDINPDELRPEPATVIIASPAGSEKKLRGIPVLADGIGSTIPGTDPLRALIAKQPPTPR